MKRLVFLLLLGSCAGAGAADTPPSPGLRDVKTSYVHADPDWIRQRGQVIGLARSRDRTLAFATLRRVDKTCVVTLPYPWTVEEALYRRLALTRSGTATARSITRRSSRMKRRSTERRSQRRPASLLRRGLLPAAFHSLTHQNVGFSACATDAAVALLSSIQS
jgi:hypothetical protein